MPYVVEHIVAERHKRFRIDRYGYFVVNLIDGKIVVDFYQKRMPTHRIIGTDAREIRDTIERLGLFNTKFPHWAQHAMYVGMEIEKAEIALRHGAKYVQDDALIVKRVRIDSRMPGRTRRFRNSKAGPGGRRRGG